MVANTSNGVVQALPAGKGSRNKRKFRADHPLGDPDKFVSYSDNDLPIYEFPSEKSDISQIHENHCGCDLCSSSLSHGHPNPPKLGPGLGSSEVSSLNQEVDDDPHDDDWSDLTESQLEELLLKNLDTVFRSAIKKIITYGYSEAIVRKAVLRSGVYYGPKDIASNIVENTVMILRNGRLGDFFKEHFFKDLPQMEKYVLAELVCVLREVKPCFSTGDAMWHLLVNDMNVTHACSLDSGSPTGSSSGGNGSTPKPAPPLKNTNTSGSDINFSAPSKSNPPGASAQICECERISISRVPNFVKPKKLPVGPSSLMDTEIKSTSGRKIPGITKREYLLRQRSLHLDKSNRTHCSKGSSRAGKLSSFGGLIFDKKLRSLSESAGVNFKSATVKITKATVVEQCPDKDFLELPSDDELEVVNSLSDLPNSAFDELVLSLPEDTSADSPLSEWDRISEKHEMHSPKAAYDDLPFSLPKDPNTDSPLCDWDRIDEKGKKDSPETAYEELPLSLPKDTNADSSLSNWDRINEKDKTMLKLVPRVRDLQAQLQEWTEWANQKVMQAARRLGKDKAELKMLRQEKEEVGKVRREKQTLEENTLKKLLEMENALGKTSGQVELANAAVKRLEAENVVLRREMEAAKRRAAESAASCQEVVKREKTNASKVQSWEKEKGLFQEELVAEKQKRAELDREVELLAKGRRNQVEARLKREEKAKEELLARASLLKRERERLEASTKEEEERIKLEAETNLNKFKDGVKKLEREISQLRLKNDSSKIAALRRGTPCLDPDEAHIRNLSRRMVAELEGYSGLKRERECVMCLSEEMSVVFLPCAHQVVCARCNELHEKQGMTDCPSCRCPIQQRVCVRYAHS